MRHQEHKVFFQFLSARLPERSLEVPAGAGAFPVAACQSTGIPGWVFPRVTVIDAFGLNDYVIARHKPYPRRFRLMAHDRYPPAGYMESYSVNYGLMTNQTSGYVPRDYEITADEIAATEQFWIERVVHGREVPFSYSLLSRIGESFIRTGEPDSSVIFLERAIALDGARARAYVSLAKYYAKVDRTDSSLSRRRTAHQLEPDDPLAQTRLGRAYAAGGYDLIAADPVSGNRNLDSAQKHLARVLAQTPTQVEALVEQASILVFRDQIDSSGIFLSRLEHLPITGLELKLLGDRYLFKQRRDLALRAYRLAIKNDLDDVSAEALRTTYPELNN